MSKFITVLASLALTGLLASCGGSDVSLFRIFEKGSNGAQGKFGFVDQSGKVQIKATYEQADDFAEGLAVVQPDAAARKFGFINTKGDLVIKAEFDSAGRFSEGLARVAKDGKVGYIDRDGKVVIPLEYESGKDFKEGLVAVSKEGKYGFADKTGKLVIETKYRFTSDFSEGLALAVNDEGKAGYIDAKGAEVIPPTFKYAGPFKEGLALAITEVDGKPVYQYITKTGKPAFDKVVGKDGKEVTVELYPDNFSEGLALFVMRDPTNPNTQLGGFINTKGEVVIDATYKLAKSFADGLAVAEKNDKIGYINKTGEWVIEPGFTNADSFKNGLALAFKDKELVYINKKGEKVWGILQSDLPGNGPEEPPVEVTPAPAQ